LLLEEGVSERKLESFFKQVNKHPMSILVLDEVDMISSRSKKSALDRRISSMLMYLIDQLNQLESKHYVYVIGKIYTSCCP
jgi:SpoVK/Ycf46/Vps4 family AAA+-type ATPase